MCYPTFSGTVGEVTNGIEDPMSSAADPAKSRVPSMAVETLKTSRYGLLRAPAISATSSSVGNTIGLIGIQEVKENRESTVDNKSWKYVCKKD